MGSNLHWSHFISAAAAAVVLSEVFSVTNLLTFRGSSEVGNARQNQRWLQGQVKPAGWLSRAGQPIEEQEDTCQPIGKQEATLRGAPACGPVQNSPSK